MVSYRSLSQVDSVVFKPAGNQPGARRFLQIVKNLEDGDNFPVDVLCFETHKNKTIGNQLPMDVLYITAAIVVNY